MKKSTMHLLSGLLICAIFMNLLPVRVLAEEDRLAETSAQEET